MRLVTQLRIPIRRVPKSYSFNEQGKKNFKINILVKGKLAAMI